MDKEDREYLMLLVRERIRGWCEIPPDNVIKEILYDLWEEFKVIQDRSRYANHTRRAVSSGCDGRWG